MSVDQMSLAFGDADAVRFHTEREYIDMLLKSKRPIGDAAFLTQNNILSKARSFHIGGLTLTAAGGSPIHVKTQQDPQYTILLPISGVGHLVQERKSVLLAGQRIIHSSYSADMTVDYEDHSICSIRPNIDNLLDAMGIEVRDRKEVKSCLLNLPTEDITNNCDRSDYYDVLRAILKFVEVAGGDNQKLERVGIENLVTKLIATLTLSVHPALRKLVKPSFTQHSSHQKFRPIS